MLFRGIKAQEFHFHRKESEQPPRHTAVLSAPKALRISLSITELVSQAARDQSPGSTGRHRVSLETPQLAGLLGWRLVDLGGHLGLRLPRGDAPSQPSPESRPTLGAHWCSCCRRGWPVAWFQSIQTPKHILEEDR